MSAQFKQFLTDVITAAGLLSHGKTDKALAERIGKAAFDLMLAAPSQPAEPVAQAEQQPKIGMRDGKYKDSTPLLHVGSSSFEDWYQAHPKAGKGGDKQLARDAYAAGMGDPLVTYASHPAAEQESERAAFEAWVERYCSPLLKRAEVLRRCSDGVYSMTSVQGNWMAWQAAARRPVHELSDDDIAAMWNESCDKYHHPRCVVDFARALLARATGEGQCG